ncbi:MAG: hypothetical protein V1767_07055 [Chloroflexota bacterium]
MPARPNWYNSYWRKMDKKTAEKIRTTCPRCGSTRTYYNEQFRTWRCGDCEYSFKVKGVRGKLPWWRRLFRKEIR